MIDQERAKKLRVGDVVHSCLYAGIKCEEWKVVMPYTEYEDRLVKSRLKKDCFSRISEANKERWHLPGECSPASRDLEVEIRRVWDGKSVGHFYVSMEATEEALQGNVALLIRGAQILAQEGFPEICNS